MTPRRLLLPVVVAAAVLAVLLLGREPEADLDPPPRGPDDVVLDPAGILDERVATAFSELAAHGWDAVALAYESPQAGEGEAQRGGRLLREAWQADLVVVAVARPGEFTSGRGDRRRAVGVAAESARSVPPALREDVAEEAMADPAGRDAWSEAFVAAAERLAAELEPGGP
ncbi:MAG: hypothetical protein ACQETV_06510 [Actinomycetota bacterium]